MGGRGSKVGLAVYGMQAACIMTLSAAHQRGHEALPVANNHASPTPGTASTLPRTLTHSVSVGQHHPAGLPAEPQCQAPTAAMQLRRVEGRVWGWSASTKHTATVDARADSRAGQHGRSVDLRTVRLPASCCIAWLGDGPQNNSAWAEAPAPRTCTRDQSSFTKCRTSMSVTCRKSCACGHEVGGGPGRRWAGA